MKHTDGSEAAFARPYSQQQPGDYVEPMYAQDGMTVREWFAGQALAGLCADGYFSNHEGAAFTPALLAQRCFAAADAMLAESRRKHDEAVARFAAERKARIERGETEEI